MTRCTKVLAGILLLMLAFTLPASAQTGWGVQRYEGFRADTTGNGNLNLTWSTGNLGNTWNEGEWVPYLLELKNVNLGNTNFSPITVCYDFTRGNLDARFVDLVRAIQIGTVDLTNSQGWPSDSNGTAFPMTNRTQLEIAQNADGIYANGTEYRWSNYVKLDIDTSQVNKDTNGNPGAPSDNTHCFTITRQDILNAYGGSPPSNTTLYIYFQLHLSQTFIWNNGLQAQLDAPPADIWGGYLYSSPAYSLDIRQGSGYVSGSSGHTYLTLGNKTVPIPIPPQPAGQLSGLKWHDINGNQVQDAGEGPLDGWPIYIGTLIGGIPISDTAYTDNTGAWVLTSLPQSLYLVSEELGAAPTTGNAAGYTNAAPAFAQIPPSTWAETYPDNTSTGTDIIGVNTPPAAVLAGYGPYSWQVDLLNKVSVGNINFGNHVPAPICAVFPSDTTICDEGQATLTAQRIAQGTPPYTYSWTGPNNFTASTQTIVVPASAAGTYTVTLTDANGLTSSGCSGTVNVFPVPDFEIAGDSIVCELSTGIAYMPQFAVNSPVPEDSIVAWQWSITGNGVITSSTTTKNISVSATTAGSFTLTLTVTDVYGCTETVTKTVTVKANPLCSITPVGDVCPGSTGNIFNGPAGAYTYAWGISGNGTINGSTTGQSVSVDAGINVGTFTLTLTITETTFPFCTSTCTLTVNVRDIEPPVITCTADTTVECPAPNPLPFTTPTAVDNCDPNPVITIVSTVTTQGSCPNEYSVTRTWVATDIYNNADTCSQTVWVIDTTPPVVTAASDLTVECDGNGNTAQLNAWLAANGGATASDACGGVTWTNDFTGLSDDCGETGSATVTFYATDDCGNVDSTSATFTIEDTTAPTVTAASDLTVECDGNGNVAQLNAWLASNGGATATDVCSGVTWTNNFNGLSDDCGETGSATVTFYATDDCGNVDSTSATFTIEDTTAPTVTAASDLTVECDGNGNTAQLNAWLANHGGATATDVCSGVTWSDNYSALNFVAGCGGSGYVDVTFYATDDCGNVDSTSARFTIEDTTPPAITTAASDTTVECDGNGNITDLNNWLAHFAGAVASDVCSDFSWSHNYNANNFVPLCGGTGYVDVTFYATDACQNVDSTTARFTIVDTTPPDITTAASDTTVECDGNGNITDLNNWLAHFAGAVASDVCSDFSWSHNYNANNFVPLCGGTGYVDVTFYATDVCQNVDSTTARFTIIDTTPPDITTAASDTTVECDGNGNITDLNNWLAHFAGAVASDVCSDFSWSHNYDANNFVPLCGGTGYVDVTFYATDVCNNVDSTTARFTIIDTTPPTVTAASDTTVECDGNGNLTDLGSWLANHGGATATDVCSDFTWSDNYDANNFVPLCGGTGYVDVTFYATDDCQNVDSTTARFTIIDTTPPDITVAASDTTVECDGNGNITDLNNWLAHFAGAVASDICSDFSWSHNYNANNFVPQCGGSGYVDVTFYATDVCGNVDSTTARFTIVDTTPPAITTAAQDTTVECDGNGNTTDLSSWLANHGGAVANDVCSNFAWTHNYNANNWVALCGNTGYVDVTFYATDVCGNVDSTSARFTIEDTTPPAITTVASDKTVECDGAGNTAELNAWLASNGGAVASDVCSNVTWTNNFTALSDDCGETGSATVTFYATDDCGNVDSTTATFTIEDTTPPSITAGSINSCYDTEAEAEAAAIAATTSSDVCSGVTLTASTVGDCNAVITVVATDDCGNADSVTYNTTIDGTPPVFTYVPPSTTIPCPATPVFGTPIATDNCGTPTINQVGNDVTTPGNCPQEYAVTRTWQAVDGCGNLSVLVSQTITVVDDIAPTITGAADDTVSCGQPIIFTDPTYSDNCDPNPTLVIVSDTTIYIFGRYYHTRTWKAVDACGNESSTVSQTIVEICNEFRSLTQGFYGNPGGSYCGSLSLSTTQLIDSLLTAHGTLVVGDPNGNGSFTIDVGKGSCVVQYLPGGGTAAPLTKHYGFSPNNCNITPNMILNVGRFNNILLSQTITLALNLRLDTLLAQSFFLPPPSTPWMRTEGADYVNGICGDLDDVPDSTFQNFYFPPSVLTYLGSNGSNVTPLDLLDLANQALGGTTFNSITLAEITAAIDAINKGFDEARFMVGFYAVPPPKAARQDFRPDGFALHQNHPNPFNPVTTITYSLPEPSTVYLAVYNALGEEISVLVDADASAGTHSVVWDSQNAPGTGSSGLFYYRIRAKGESGAVFHDQRKMMLVK